MVRSIDYSVIVPAYNEEQWLPKTLFYLNMAMQAIDRPGELIVVDNNSSDHTAQVAQGHGATVVFEPVNQISRARNRGARAARGEYLIFVDADTTVSVRLLQEAIRLMSSGVACGGGTLVRPDAGANRWADLGTRLWNTISRQTGLAAGCFIFCRRDAFDAAGGFSQKVYASEELWLSRRLQKWGKARGQPFTIITGDHAITSARKTEWYSPLRLLLAVSLLVVFPWSVRFRSLCGFWYQRPEVRPGSESRSPGDS
ncbi:MAG: family 2 glycosyl transferase [Gammaproteobacteria bacterium]|nr:MAG: family 2 glycosyl transferase [Gammaproteobacteria bacterium]TND05807.1 MAG: family 2 glycosyl transferase [Gammaproteobacteria bacterium]